MKKIILAGNATTAKVVSQYLKRDKRYEVLATVADDEFLPASDVVDIPGFGMSSITERLPPRNHIVIMAAGYGNVNKVRESLFQRLKEQGYQIETYIHPDAHVHTEHPLGEGCVVLPGAVVEPGARIASNTMVWCNATIAHDSYVAENCWIASGSVISGQAAVGRNTFIGVNATVVNNVVVSEFNIIGGGALITKCTKPNTVHLARSAEELRYGAEDYTKHFLQ